MLNQPKRPADWGQREKHPHYQKFHWHKVRNKYGMVKEWADDFWVFVEAIGEQPEGCKIARKDRHAPIGPDNWHWKETFSNKDTAAYQRDWRKKNLRTVKGYDFQRSYGISVDDYEAMVAAQNGVCAICAKPPKKEGRYVNLCVDHCHDNGKVRGLLCDNCNRGLGLFGDDYDNLRKALNYLLANYGDAPNPT